VSTSKVLIEPGATGRLPIPRDMDEFVRDALPGTDFFDGETGRPLNAFAILANSHPVLEAVLAIRPILNGPSSELTAREKECIAIRTATLIGCDYEQQMRVQTARRYAGMSDQELASLTSPDFGQATNWDGRERAIVGLAESLCATESVDDDLLSEMQTALGPSLLVEAIFRCAYTRMMLALLKVAQPPLETLEI
jgi:alkylhydroperoxidase family enzyme